MTDGHVVICRACGWEKEFVPSDSFLGRTERSATQAGRGHIGHCHGTYMDIVVVLLSERSPP